MRKPIKADTKESDPIYELITRTLFHATEKQRRTARIQETQNKIQEWREKGKILDLPDGSHIILPGQNKRPEGKVCEGCKQLPVFGISDWRSGVFGRVICFWCWQNAWITPAKLEKKNNKPTFTEYKKTAKKRMEENQASVD